MKIRKLIVLIGILVLPSLAFCADDSLEFRVKLDVRGDESLGNRIENILSGELRTLSDVIRSEDKYEYDISVLGVKLKNEVGDEIGIVLSVNVHTKFDNQALSSMFNKKFVKEGMVLTNDLYHYPKHWVRSGSVYDLRSLCRGIIADFDGKILQKQRDAMKEDRIFDLDK